MRRAVNLKTKPRKTASRPKKTAGLRRVEVWIPDMDGRTFRREAHRQSLLAAQSPHEADDQAFVDSITEKVE